MKASGFQNILTGVLRFRRHAGDWESQERSLLFIYLLFTLGSAQKEGILSFKSLNVSGIDQIFLYIFDHGY